MPSSSVPADAGRQDPRFDVYSIAEIARAAGVPTADVRAVPGAPGALVPFAEAVRIGRALLRPVAPRETDVPRAAPLFAIFSPIAGRPSRGVPLAVSSAVHVGALIAAVLIATTGLAPVAAPLQQDRPDPMRLVFVATPGPGGGGGGGGLLQPKPAPTAEREGRHMTNSPVPARRPPRAIIAIAQPREPRPAVLTGESLPVLVAPIVPAAADARDRPGVLARTSAEEPGHGPGALGGAGTGSGTGIGEGSGPGVGPGSGGGTGGGPYRPGSGIEPPRLVREVKADYTEAARRRGIEGEVLLEIVVRRDGTVGDVRVERGLDAGLDANARDTVRRWRFAPAVRQSVPVDVVVEVAVEFKLR